MVDHNNPQSRNEEILIAIIDGREYNKAPQSRIEELLLELKEVIEEGGGGTSNYSQLTNKPQINGVTLSGEMTAADLSLVLAEVGKGLSTNDYSDEEKAKVTNLVASIQAILDGTDLDSFGDVEVALLDKADISDLGTAAAKDSTNAVTSGSTDLVESGAVKDAIDAAVSKCYHHAGTKTVAQLTHDLLIAANEGNVYEMTDSGTTTSDFMEGIGRPIKEGDNVGIARISEGVYKFDLLSGFVDTSNFVQKSSTVGLIMNDGTIDTVAKQPVTDNSLTTTDKTTTGAINELKSGLTNVENELNGDATTYPYADVITIENAIPANLADCKVKVEPVQDLHGYDKPWVGGAGKNKLPLVLAEIKSLNTDGTWSENVYTENSVKYTVLLDNDGNVIGVNIDGVTSTATGIILAANQTFDTDCLLSKGDSSGVGVVSLALLNNAGTEVAVEATSTGATVEAGNYGNVRIRVNANITVSNVYIYPMIRLATETDSTFAPYTNICPISGHTEVDVQRDGNDVWSGNDTYTSISAGYVIPSTTISLPIGTYAFEFDCSNPNGLMQFEVFKNNSQQGTDRIYNSDGFNVSTHNMVKFTINEAGTNLRLYSNNSSGASISNVKLFSTVQTYTIQLGDTIYGGTVDFDSGVMTVDRQCIELDTLNWSRNADWGGYPVFYSNALTNYNATAGSALPNAICSDYEGVTRDYLNVNNVTAFCIASNSNLTIRDDRYDNELDFAAAMDGVQLCYELATPTTIQLTPQQIQLLKGTNTLYASAGQISVTVNGVSGAIGQVQEQVNELAEEVAQKLPDAPTTDGTYSLQVTVADGVPTYSWVSAE